jgi:quinoprotein glucose dehydrogenase
MLAPAALLAASAPGDRVPLAPRSASSGVYSAVQAERGRALYQVQCASCHGAALAGADTNPPLTGGRFLANWTGQSVAALAKRIRTTMPLDQPGKLGLAETADLVAYLLLANDFRGADVELPSSPRELDVIKIDAAQNNG